MLKSFEMSVNPLRWLLFGTGGLRGHGWFGFHLLGYSLGQVVLLMMGAAVFGSCTQRQECEKKPQKRYREQVGGMLAVDAHLVVHRTELPELFLPSRGRSELQRSAPE